MRVGNLQPRLWGALFGSSLILAASASAAEASVTLGETFVPDSCGTDTYIQTADPGNRYMVPFDGVITHWSYQSDASPPSEIRFKVGRTAPGADLTMNTDVTIVGQSALETPAASALNTYTTQIPVKAGDRIGEYVTDDCSRADPAYTDHYFGADVQPGSTFLFTQENYQQDISAVLEPSNTFSLGKIKRNKKKGTATLSVEVPNPGTLVLGGKGVKGASTAGAVISKTVGAAGTVKLVIKAKGKQKRKLKKKGKVKLKTKITFTPTGGDPATQTKKLKLKRKKR